MQSFLENEKEFKPRKSLDKAEHSLENLLKKIQEEKNYDTNIETVKLAIEKDNSLLTQISTDKEKLTLLHAIVRKMRDISTPKLDSQNQACFHSLKALAIFIIKTYPDKIDPAAKKSENDTVLHNTFWYARRTELKEISDVFTEIGITLIKISPEQDWGKLFTEKNNRGETVYKNIFEDYGSWLPQSKNVQDKVSVEFDMKKIFFIKKLPGDDKNGTKMLHKILHEPIKEIKKIKELSGFSKIFSSLDENNIKYKNLSKDITNIAKYCSPDLTYKEETNEKTILDYMCELVVKDILDINDFILLIQNKLKNTTHDEGTAFFQAKNHNNKNFSDILFDAKTISKLSPTQQQKLPQIKEKLSVFQPEIFSALANGNVTKVNEILKTSPMVVNQQDPIFRATPLIALIIKIKDVCDEKPAQANQILRLNTLKEIALAIIKSDPDLSITDDKGNTALHYLVHYAKTVDSDAHLDIFLAIEQAVINQIKASLDPEQTLRKLSQIKNQSGENFLSNLYYPLLRDDKVNKNTQRIAEVIDPLLVVRSDQTKESYLTLREQISVLLIDPRTNVQLEDPYYIPSVEHGNTLSKKIWQDSKTSLNPYNRKKFDPSQAIANTEINELLKILSDNPSLNDDKLLKKLEQSMSIWRKSPNYANNLLLRNFFNVIAEFKALHSKADHKIADIKVQLSDSNKQEIAAFDLDKKNKFKQQLMEISKIDKKRVNSIADQFVELISVLDFLKPSFEEYLELSSGTCPEQNFDFLIELCKDDISHLQLIENIMLSLTKLNKQMFKQQVLWLILKNLSWLNKQKNYPILITLSKIIETELSLTSPSLLKLDEPLQYVECLLDIIGLDYADEYLDFTAELRAVGLKDIAEKLLDQLPKLDWPKKKEEIKILHSRQAAIMLLKTAGIWNQDSASKIYEILKNNQQLALFLFLAQGHNEGDIIKKIWEEIMPQFNQQGYLDRIKVENMTMLFNPKSIRDHGRPAHTFASSSVESTSRKIYQLCRLNKDEKIADYQKLKIFKAIIEPLSDLAGKMFERKLLKPAGYVLQPSVKVARDALTMLETRADFLLNSLLSEKSYDGLEVSVFKKISDFMNACNKRYLDKFETLDDTTDHEKFHDDYETIIRLIVEDPQKAQIIDQIKDTDTLADIVKFLSSPTPEKLLATVNPLSPMEGVVLESKKKPSETEGTDSELELLLNGSSYSSTEPPSQSTSPELLAASCSLKQDLKNWGKVVNETNQNMDRSGENAETSRLLGLIHKWIIEKTNDSDYVLSAACYQIICALIETSKKMMISSQLAIYSKAYKDHVKEGVSVVPTFTSEELANIKNSFELEEFITNNTSVLSQEGSVADIKLPTHSPSPSLVVTSVGFFSAPAPTPTPTPTIATSSMPTKVVEKNEEPVVNPMLVVLGKGIQAG